VGSVTKDPCLLSSVRQGLGCNNKNFIVVA
jgi:hypothetical protein